MILRCAPLRHQFASRACLFFLLLLSIDRPSTVDAATSDAIPSAKTLVSDLTYIAQLDDLKSANLAEEITATDRW